MDYRNIDPRKHIIHSKQFTEPYFQILFESATKFKSGFKSDCLKDKIFVLLFNEASTRTRFSFHSAILRLGGKVISAEQNEITLSFSKGETIEDTARMLNLYADCIIIRDSKDTSADEAMRTSKIPIINAGTGTAQHPTQTLLDIYTIQEKFGRYSNLSITIVGDLLRGRTVNSLLYILAKYNNNFTLVSNESSKISPEMREFLQKNKVSYKETDDLENSISNCDICYMTRIQKERFKNEEEFNNINTKFILNQNLADLMKEESIIMHPLPRIDEITKAVDINHRALYFRQAENGLYVRMALLSLMDYTKE